ncbi:histidine kinase [Dictyobacter formicarum]|uniref:Histidine kinase n=1 Tax=Dictyobacter formicarum TaxID=2778368 RepID=A0ABQ3VMF4_9CHLR|nr:histidine kinase [Dictyobacter formicarum]
MYAVIFLVLLGLHGVLLWLGLSGRIARRYYWFYFALQGCLVLIASLTIQQINVAMNLYLALTLAAISMLRQARSAVVVAGGYLFLLIFCTMLNLSFWNLVKLPPFDGRWSIVWLNLWNTSDYLALLFFVIGYLMLYTHQLRTHAQLAYAYTCLGESAARIEELTRVTERQRLARELHDTLAQGLAGIRMQIQVASSHLDLRHYTRAQQIMQQVMISSHEMLNTARRAIDDLRVTFTSPEKFYAVIREEIHRFIEMTGVVCTVSGLDLLMALPFALHEHVLRMLGEALSNIVRHAQAQHVWLNVELGEDILTMTVRDDGVGFDPVVVRVQSGHYGLQGLIERTCLVGGDLEVTSSPGQGTTLHFTIPRSLDEE